MKSNTLILAITPQTNVRTTQADRIWFQIPEDCPKGCGAPRRKTSKAEGCRHCLPHDGLRRKRRIERYNRYKEDLLTLALQQRFTHPQIGAGITFHLPLPKRVRSKKQRALLHGSWHTQKPDIDNMLKAYFDALMANDQGIAQLTCLGKKWVDSDTGWIEVALPAPHPAEVLLRRVMTKLVMGEATLPQREQQDPHAYRDAQLYLENCKP
jgi:Holliday junction resolvase RusA-like endonuclease